MTKIISKFLAIIMIMNIISVNYIELAFSEGEKSTSIDISTYKDGNIKKIQKGQKGVEYNIDSLHIDHGKGYKLNKNASTLGDHIKILVNGEVQDYINTEDDKLKFDFTYDAVKGTIKIGIKEGQSNNTHMKPFILRKHSLYNVIISPGLFIEENGKKSSEINHTFVTKGDGTYGSDIIKDISPGNLSTSIDYNKGVIRIDFIDDIYLESYVYANKQNYFEIKSSSITDPKVADNDKIENINNFNINIDANGSTLRLVSKDGRLNDFAKYTVSIKAGTVQLADSRNFGSDAIISNSARDITFATDNWIDSINLHTSEGWMPYKLPLANINDVPLNPLIQVKFKYPVELKNRSKIKLSSDADDFSINLDSDSWINYDGNILKLDVNGMNKAGKNPLRKNTAYKITVGKGALSLKGYSNEQTNSKIENEDMYIYFITGDWTTNTDPGLYVTGYSSGDPIMDDITDIDNTKLEKNGEIFIHFNRKIQWNKWDTNVSSDAAALSHFKLYKIPSAYERDYTEKGIIFDKQYRYGRDRKIFPYNILGDEIPIKSVRLYNNVIQIVPKYELTNLNKYRIVMDDKNIVTDFKERKLTQNINQTIWTNRNVDGVPEWIVMSNTNPGEMIKPEEIIEDTHSPYQYQGYKIYGVPEYNEHIDNKENGKPIIVYMDKEVILNPWKPNKANPDALSGISLLEGHGNQTNKAIEWYKIEYIRTKEGVKTKISLYPRETVDSGKYYILKIPNNTFVTRSGEHPKYGAELKFVIEGQKIDKRGINRIDYTGSYTDPMSIYDTNSSLKLDIKGFNFTEDIRSIRLRNTLNTNDILLSANDFTMEFINVDNVKITIKQSGLNKIRKNGNGGTYEVHLEFGDGNAGPVDKDVKKLTFYERPYAVVTNPRANDLNVKKDDLHHTLPNGVSGKYLTVIFDNINGKLNKCDNVDISDFEFHDELGKHLIDTSRGIYFEGLGNTTTPMKTKIAVEGEKRDTVMTGFTSAKLYLDNDDYKIGDNMKITLFDADLSGSATVKVFIDDEEKTVTLTEVGYKTGQFEGNISVWGTKGQTGKISVKYIDVQPAIAPINTVVEVEADIVQNAAYRRGAQIYIDRAIYEKEEEVKVTVVDKNNSGSGPIKVEIEYLNNPGATPTNLTLNEMGNTGVFKVTSKLGGNTDKFKITYKYEESASTGTSVKSEISRKVKMYIPIKDELEDGVVYTAKIPAGILCYGADQIASPHDDKRGNHAYGWSFKTTEVIKISVDIKGKFKGSVPEEYDASYPIVINGDNFTDRLSVYFVDMQGKKEYKGTIKTVKGNNKVLHVFLPDGSGKLPVGLYNIVVRNPEGDEYKIEYGVLSVVPKGEFVPNEEYVEKNAVKKNEDPSKDPIKIGGLKKYTKKSHDTLELGSGYSSGVVELNLDEIMGEEVWLRNIAYLSSGTISQLATKSRWSDITLTNVDVSTSSLVRVGRAAIVLEDNIKKKISGKVIKSHFIEVGGENYTASKLNMNIPFKESDGKGLKLLRYDEDTRRVTEIKLEEKNINIIDKRIEIELLNKSASDNMTKGVFVVVE